MEPVRLTESCSVCQKSAARWTITVTTVLPRSELRTPIFFCPRCDAFTPEDLDLSDTRTITLPKPTEQPASNYRLTFGGAAEYRDSMGPERPFRKPNSRTMKRRYNARGEEIADLT